MKTSFGYKLFEMDKRGNLYPLFIGKKDITPFGEWVPAEYIPTKGYAARGGWHIGADIPSAPWLMAFDGTYKSQRGKTFRRVWCLVEYNATNDLNDYVQTLPKKCITDGCPVDGYYFFREVGKGTWVITSDIKVVKIISEQERQEIMANMGYDEGEAFRPYYDAMAKRIQ